MKMPRSLLPPQPPTPCPDRGGGLLVSTVFPARLCPGRFLGKQRKLAEDPAGWGWGSQHREAQTSQAPPGMPLPAAPCEGRRPEEVTRAPG